MQTHRSRSRSGRPVYLPCPVIPFVLAASIACGGQVAAPETATPPSPEKRVEKLVPGALDHESGVGGAADPFPDTLFDAQDARLLGRLESVALGGTLALAEVGAAGPEAMANAGFTPVSGGYRRDANLDAKLLGLVQTHSDALPGIDCIAMISILRTKENENYIFSTLRNMFEVFPQDAHINILVGDGDTSYLDTQILQSELGAAWAARLHVLETGPVEARFLSENLDIKIRAGWNYARAIRSYAGDSGLLLLEDDIVWSANAVRHMARWTAREHPAVISLYTRSDYLRVKNATRGDLIRVPMRGRTPGFEGTQALYISRRVSEHLGRHLQLRLHETAYDWNLDRFLRKYDILMGYAFPSLVQHIGRKSSGLGCFHESDCFDADY